MFPVSDEKGLVISEQQYFAKNERLQHFYINLHLYHLISEKSKMRLMNHYHCQHKRMWRKEFKSRQSSVFGIGVVWPLRKPNFTPST